MPKKTPDHDQMKIEIQALKLQVNALRIALRPMARAWEWLHALKPDEREQQLRFSDLSSGCIYWKDCERAAEVLAATEEK